MAWVRFTYWFVLRTRRFEGLLARWGAYTVAAELNKWKLCCSWQWLFNIRFHCVTYSMFLRGFIKFLCRRSVGFYSQAFFVFWWKKVRREDEKVLFTASQFAQCPALNEPPGFLATIHWINKVPILTFLVIYFLLTLNFYLHLFPICHP